MAGSYKHVAKDDGSLRSRSEFLQLIDNWGDAYESVEEMYGMIWFLASYVKNLTEDKKLDGSPYTMDEIVEHAQKAYKIGIERSPTNTV